MRFTWPIITLEQIMYHLRTPSPILPQHQEHIEMNSIRMGEMYPNPPLNPAPENQETGPQVVYAENEPTTAPQVVPDAAISGGEIQQAEISVFTAETETAAPVGAVLLGSRGFLSAKTVAMIITGFCIVVVALSAVVAAAFTGGLAQASGFGGASASNISNFSSSTAADTATETWTSNVMLFTDTVDFGEYFTQAYTYPTTLPLPTTGTTVFQENTLTTSTTSGHAVTILAAPSVAPLPTGTVYALPTGTLPLPLQLEASNHQCADQLHAIGLGPCDPFLFGVEITALERGYVLSTFPRPLFTGVLLDYPVGDRPWSGSAGGFVEHAFAGTVSKACQTYKQYNVWFGKYGEVWLHLTHTLHKPCLIEKENGEKINLLPTLCECSWSGVLPV